MYIFLLIALFFLQEEKETVDICTNCSVFLQDEKETVEFGINCIVFLQEKRL